MKKSIFNIIFALVSISTFAHEGHDSAPGAFKSLHGGTVQNGKELNLEVIVAGKEITIFPTTHESKDALAKDIKIVATAKPKKGKPYPVTLTNEKIGYKASIDLNGANRVPVEIIVTSHGKVDSFVVQVEE